MGILSYFVDVKEDEKPKEAAPSSILNTPNSLGKPAAIPTPGFVSPIPSATTEADLGKFTNHFDDLFNKSNLPGPDYYEFSKMVQAINVPGMSEDMKLTAAFAGLSVQGLTVEKLLSSSQQYLDIIDNDAKQFGTAIDSKVNTELEGKKKLIVQQQQQLKAKQEMIAQLQQELVSDTASIDAATNEIAAQEQALASKANSYKIACETKKQQILNDVEKIKTFLNK